MLKHLRKTKTAVALAAALGAAAVVPNAQAVNLTSDGLGDLLFFPYYSVRSGWNSYFHLTNTSDRTAILKVRWREAYNSRDVRDFNLILSPHDVWTAAVTPNAAGTGAAMKSDDKSCTAPQLPDIGGGFTGIDFTNAAYSGGDDGGPTGLDRTMEGYFEVYLMGLSNVAEGAIANTDVVEWNSQHVNGVPRDCDMVEQQFAAPPDAGVGVFASFLPPSDNGFANRNVIAGNSTLINVAVGQAVGVDPTTLASCEVDNIYRPGDTRPTSADCANTTAIVVDSYAGDGIETQVLETDFTAPQDAVSATIMRSSVINEWTTAAATVARTDWVVTYPTKHHYTDGVARLPFTEEFDGKSCDDVTIKAWDREEKTPEGDIPFSPSEENCTQLCYEVNVLTFNNSNILGSSVGKNINPAVGDRGWARIGQGVRTLTGTNPADVYTGKPVIGFALTVRNNAVVVGNNRNYASAHDHKYERDIVPATPAGG